jgi:hypothetical protein
VLCSKWLSFPTHFSKWATTNANIRELKHKNNYSYSTWNVTQRKTPRAANTNLVYFDIIYSLSFSFPLLPSPHPLRQTQYPNHVLCVFVYKSIQTHISRKCQPWTKESNSRIHTWRWLQIENSKVRTHTLPSTDGGQALDEAQESLPMHTGMLCLLSR